MTLPVRSLLLGLALASGPVFWFPIIGKVIFFKAGLFFILFFFFFKKLIYSRFSFFLVFSFLFVFYNISLSDYKDSFFEKFLNVYMDLLFAWFFLCVGDTISLKDMRFAVRISLVGCICYCILFLICQTFGIIKTFPVEYSYLLSNGLLGIEPFSDTGWGFGRTQWSTCLSVFIPALFFFYPDKTSKNYKKDYFFFALVASCIFSIQMISGGRGGIIASLLSFFFCLFFIVKRKLPFLFMSVCLCTLLMIIVYTNQEFFRISGSSLSEARSEQWSLVFDILKNLPFWGYGEYGQATVMVDFGIPHAFHDSFLRFLFGFGFPAFCEGLFILYLLVRGFKNMLAHKDNVCIIALYGILFAGFVCSFTEPNPIFVTFYWPFWWISAGYLYNLAKEDFMENQAQIQTSFNQEEMNFPFSKGF